MSAKASEPEEASDRQKAPSVSVASLGSHCCCSSGFAHMVKVLFTMVL